MVTAKRTTNDRPPATRLPVARVCVDVGLSHLDRPFDYRVPADLDEAAQPGVRVKVRFAGKLLDGWILDRAETSAHAKLAWLEKVVSPERVLTAEVAALARAVADRYAGSLSDVLRLAVPPRHARVEAQRPVPAGDSGEGEPADQAEQTDEPDVGPPHRPMNGAADGPAGASRSGSVGRSIEGSASGAGAEPDDTAADGVAGGELTAGSPDRGPGASDAGHRSHPGSDRLEPRLHEAEGRGDSGGVGGRGEPGRVGDPGAVTGRSGALPWRGPVAGGWDSYPTGEAYLRALADGRVPRAVWSALPGEDWPMRFAEAAGATVAGGRGAVAVVADARDLDRLDRALTAVLGAGRHVALSAASGPAERYRRFLAASRGEVDVVVGTRAAMFAPVPRLGLVALWDDGDDLHREPRAPYPHARDVLLTRARLADAAVLVGGWARTGEAQLLVETGWAREIVAERDELRRRTPAVTPTGDDPQLARDPGAATARLPSLAWQAARQALQRGRPVLVQVPRRGYLPSMSCGDCRAPARCPHCSGPLALGEQRAVPACHWCARVSAGWACPQCGGRKLRAAVTGARRTAEELGRAFPGVPVRTSGREEVLAEVPGEAAVVVATPGAEPPADGGYGAVLLLDAWALLTRADLRAGEEALRRWLAAAALARADGTVVVVADGSLPVVQALLRWDPGWFAARELAERRELGFPPAARMASLTGTAEAVADLLAEVRLPERAEVLGPVPAGDDAERMLVRVPRGDAAALAGALHAGAAGRSARKATPVRIQVDPADLF